MGEGIQGEEGGGEGREELNMLTRGYELDTILGGKAKSLYLTEGERE